MKITKYFFIETFTKLDERNTFTYDGLGKIYEYLEDVPQDITFSMLDIILMFTEHNSLNDFNVDNGTDYNSLEELSQDFNILMIDDESFLTIE